MLTKTYNTVTTNPTPTRMAKVAKQKVNSVVIGLVQQGSKLAVTQGPAGFA